MNTTTKFATPSTALLLAGALALVSPSRAQELPSEGPVATTATIRAEVKNHAPLDPSMLKLDVNGHSTPISAVTPIMPAGAQVAILIDDGLRGSFDTQLRDVRSFIAGLPAGMQVLVGYMQNGRVASEMGFTTDHAPVSKQLRIPLSVPDESAGPYFCLSEFVKHWPSQAQAPRFVLMITNGVDPYNGSVSVLNQDSPYVKMSQEDSERAGVAVYSIYFPDRAEGGNAASFSGQSYLNQVGSATGAETLWTGNIPPVDFQPLLNRFLRDINESYTVQFRASANREKRTTLAEIKLKSSQPEVKLHVPDAVHPGVVDTTTAE